MVDVHGCSSAGVYILDLKFNTATHYKYLFTLQIFIYVADI